MSSILFKNSLRKCKSVKDRIKSVLSESNIFFSFFFKRDTIFFGSIVQVHEFEFSFEGKILQSGDEKGRGRKREKGKRKS